MFWDKLEKANYFSREYYQHQEMNHYESRLITASFKSTCARWRTVGYVCKSYINKYGAVPKDVMPETNHSSKSGSYELYSYSQIKRVCFYTKKETS